MVIKIKAIREKLIKNRDNLPLFDVKSFVSNLENKLIELWNKRKKGKQQRGFQTKKRQQKNKKTSSPIRENYQQANYHFQLAQKLKAEDKLDGAVKHYREAIKLFPSYASAYNNLGTILQTKENLTEAKSCYLTALKINPHLAAAHNNLGSIWQLEGDLVKARKKFNQCLNIEPNYFLAWFNLAGISLTEGERERAKQELNQALKFNPNYLDALRKLIDIVREEAKLAYKKALSLEANNLLYQCIYNYFRLKLADWENYEQNFAT